MRSPRHILIAALAITAIGVLAGAAAAAKPKLGTHWTGKGSQGSTPTVAFKTVRRGKHGRSVAGFRVLNASLSCNNEGVTRTVSLPGRAKVDRHGRFKRTRTTHAGATKTTFKVRGRFTGRRKARGIYKILRKNPVSGITCYTQKTDWTATLPASG
jgi:hypothetical protein